MTDEILEECLPVFLQEGKTDISIHNSMTMSLDVLVRILSEPNAHYETQLSLEYNGIQSLSKNMFGCISGLYYINLDNNNLTELGSETFSNMTKLKHVNIQYNRLERIASMAFYNLPNLQTVRLFTNRIKELASDAFANINSISVFDIAKNNLSSGLYEALQNNTGLRELTFEDNAIQTLPEDMEYILKNIKEIHFWNNPWHCDCDLVWLIKRVDNNKNGDRDPFPTCQTPSVTNMTSFDFSTCEEEPDIYVTNYITILYVGGAVSALAAISVGVLCYCRSKRRSNRPILMSIETATFGKFKKTTRNDMYHRRPLGIFKSQSIYASEEDTCVTEHLFSEGKLYQKLTLGKLIGSGDFGSVYEGYVVNGHNQHTRVAVKKLRENASPEQANSLVKELENLQELGSHANIIRMYECCIIDGIPNIIMELAEHGDLLAFLQQIEKANSKRIASLDSSELPTYIQRNHPILYIFMWHVAKGMEYLSQMKIVHRDLAARNILICEGNVAKVSDFGLSRDVYETGFYIPSSNGKVPFKWMSPETWVDGKYTTKSDVWSFGVLLWEIVTLGSSPYPDLNLHHLIRMLQSGYIMPKPNLCPPNLYAIMKECWTYNPEARPCFKTLIDNMDVFIQNTLNTEYVVVSNEV